MQELLRAAYLYQALAKTTMRRLHWQAQRRAYPQPPKRLLTQMRGLAVYLVDGAWIRNNLDVEFALGGNPARYAYVPKGEVWVESGLVGDDKMETALHEVTEYHDMKDRGQTYDKAHDNASDVEVKQRAKIPGN